MGLEVAYQPWLSSERAKARPEPVIDFTNKYALAANERRAREAERARQQKAKDDKAADSQDYHKSLGGLSSEWASEDIPVRDKLYTDLTRTVHDANGDFTSQAFQQEFYKKLNEFQTAQQLSKKWDTQATNAVNKIKEAGVDEYDNTDILPSMAEGKYTLKTPDGQEISHDVKNVKGLQDFAEMDVLRNKLLGTVEKKFNESSYMKNYIDQAHKAARTESYVTLPDGTKELRVVEKPELYQPVLDVAWNGKEKLRKMWEDRYAQDPKGFGSAEEMFQAAYNPFFGGTKKTPRGTVKNEDVKKNLGGNRAQIGNTIFQYYDNGNGKETIYFTGKTEGDNPERKFFANDTKSFITARPDRWEIDQRGTPYLIVQQTEKDKGEETITEHKVMYDKAAEAGLQYANPSEIKQLLGVTGGEGAKSVKGTGGAPAATNITPAEWNKRWAALKKGETLVGLDGKTYTKK